MSTLWNHEVFLPVFLQTFYKSYILLCYASYIMNVYISLILYILLCIFVSQQIFSDKFSSGLNLFFFSSSFLPSSFNFFNNIKCLKLYSAWKYSITNMPTLEPELCPLCSNICQDAQILHVPGQNWKLYLFSYRIPSNPSVGSKGSYKISTDSIGRNSDRSSPLPSYHVEVLPLLIWNYSSFSSYFQNYLMHLESFYHKI